MTSTPKIYAAWFVALALLAGPARAQDDTALFGITVQPNVMIIFDNSGSMAHAMWPTTFDPKLFYDSAAIYSNAAKNCNTGTFNLGAVPEIANSTGLCPGSGDDDADANADECPESEWSYLTSGSRFRCANIPSGCASAPAGWTCATSGRQPTFTVPDITAGAGGSRWSRNYLHWIANQMYATGAPPVIPTLDRVDIAETAIVDVVDAVNPDGFAEKVRFGVGTFGNNAAGGTVLANIATGNKATVIAQLQALQPTGNTPLAESTVSMAQYMTGLASVGNCSGSTTLNPCNPMQDWCRKNFIVMVTDGESVDDDFSDVSGGTAGFTCAIGNFDGDTNDPNNRTDRPPFQNGGTDWFDDVTTYCYETDLRPDLNATQNIVTYTIGLLIDHPLLVEAATQAGGTFFVANSAQELSDTLTATVLEIIERSTAFSAATVPSSRTAFSDGLFVASFIPRTAFRQLGGPPRGLPHHPRPRRSSATTTSPRSTRRVRSSIRRTTSGTARTRSATQSVRTLYTNLSGARTDFTAGDHHLRDVRHHGGIALDRVDHLSRTISRPVPARPTRKLADDLVSYVYGVDAYDEDRDTDSAETRDYVLGDLFHSNPIVIGPPPFALNDEDGFGPLGTTGTFLELYHERDRRLFVGGNDGVLHAIDTGWLQHRRQPADPRDRERLLRPGHRRGGLRLVAGLAARHDQVLPAERAAHVLLRGRQPVGRRRVAAELDRRHEQGAPREWTTLLVTGMRQGGRSYLALDVTDPAAGASDAHGPYPVFQWEFDDPSEPMGETWSDPIITRIKMRAATGTNDQCGTNNGDGDCVERWVVIVAGGYDDTADPNLAGWIDDPADASWTEYGKGVFVLDAQTGAVLGEAGAQRERRAAPEHGLRAPEHACGARPELRRLRRRDLRGRHRRAALEVGDPRRGGGRRQRRPDRQLVGRALLRRRFRHGRQCRALPQHLRAALRRVRRRRARAGVRHRRAHRHELRGRARARTTTTACMSSRIRTRWARARSPRSPTTRAT